MTPLEIILLAIFAMNVYVAIHRRQKPRYFAMAEYWVYLPGDRMPLQDDIMTLMVASNPYGRGGRSPIGTAEGLVFSDIRLHIALVLRSKNPHIFRPDLFEEHIQPTKEILESLSAAQSLVKLRFASDIPLKDKRHLQFPPPRCRRHFRTRRRRRHF